MLLHWNALCLFNNKCCKCNKLECLNKLDHKCVWQTLGQHTPINTLAFHCNNTKICFCNLAPTQCFVTITKLFFAEYIVVKHSEHLKRGQFLLVPRFHCSSMYVEWYIYTQFKGPWFLSNVKRVFCTYPSTTSAARAVTASL